MMYDFPNATIVFSTNKLEDLENKIKEIKSEHRRINGNCEVEVICEPSLELITFDVYTNLQFQLSVYVRYLSIS